MLNFERGAKVNHNHLLLLIMQTNFSWDIKQSLDPNLNTWPQLFEGWIVISTG